MYLNILHDTIGSEILVRLILLLCKREIIKKLLLLNVTLS